MADGYDPRMLQMARMGIGMMGPQAGPFDRANQPKQWWDQPLPQSQRRNDDNPSGQPANQPANPSKQQPSLLQMLMLGGPATYSGTPTGGAASSGYSPWGWLGSMGMPGGSGWGGPGVK
jgi:hypothetical protein